MTSQLGCYCFLFRAREHLQFRAHPLERGVGKLLACSGPSRGLFWIEPGMVSDLKRKHEAGHEEEVNRLDAEIVKVLGCRQFSGNID